MAVASLGYAMSFARGTRYDLPLRLCRDIKMCARMPDRLPYVSTIDSNSLPTTSVPYVVFPWKEDVFNAGAERRAFMSRAPNKVRASNGPAVH